MVLPAACLEAPRRRPTSAAVAPDVGDAALSEFLDHGFTRRNALEVVLGIRASTLSTLANRVTGAPVDEQPRAFA
jgi:hypothetical protein